MIQFINLFTGKLHRVALRKTDGCQGRAVGKFLLSRVRVMASVRIMLERAMVPGIWAVGDAGAVGLIGVTLLGLVPPAAGLLAILWYCVQIYESKTLQNTLRTRRLKRLVRLRAQATALELLIREKNTNLSSLDLANAVHTAAVIAATDITHAQNEIDIKKEEAEDIHSAAIDALERLNQERNKKP